MYLAVYLGTHVELKPPEKVPHGCLSIELADWCPAPLTRFPHVYFVGSRHGELGEPLGCSCLLMEHVCYGEHGPVYEAEFLSSGLAMDPIETLRELCEVGLAYCDVALACDDGGGGPQGLRSDDYNRQFLPVQKIKKGSLIFSDVDGGFPARAYSVLPATFLDSGDAAW